MTKIIERLDDISDDYEAVFCDLWGCVHNGRDPFPEAVAALERFRDRGGFVLLLTNSPRPKAQVVEQLGQIGIAADVYHEVATSGDSARAALASGQFGQRVFHLGPDRDLPFFEPSPFLQGLSEIELVDFDQAEAIVCTGLFNDKSETPDDYKATLLAAKSRGLKMLCANPDIVVDHGTQRIFCAGALAQAYVDRGGEAFYFGKPHPPIYDLARNRMTHSLGRVVPDSKILCIGDGIVTDVPGALGERLDCLFVSGGLAASETGTLRQPDPDLLHAFLDKNQFGVAATIGHLR